MGRVDYISLCLLGCLIFNPSLAAPVLSVKAQEASCSEDWIYLHGNCYRYFSEQKIWMEAEAECQRHGQGAHLASIHSAGENNILARYINWQNKKDKHGWIGLWDPDQAEWQRHGQGAHLASIHSTGENNILARYDNWQDEKDKHVWIGLWDPDQNKNWIWTDESQMNFYAWDNGQPNNLKENELCVGFSKSTGFKKWHDYPCEDKYSFVCKHKPKGRKLAAPGGSQHLGFE